MTPNLLKYGWQKDKNQLQDLFNELFEEIKETKTKYQTLTIELDDAQKVIVQNCQNIFKDTLVQLKEVNTDLSKFAMQMNAAELSNNGFTEFSKTSYAQPSDFCLNSIRIIGSKENPVLNYQATFPNILIGKNLKSFHMSAEIALYDRSNKPAVVSFEEMNTESNKIYCFFTPDNMINKQYIGIFVPLFKHFADTLTMERAIDLEHSALLSTKEYYNFLIEKTKNQYSYCYNTEKEPDELELN